jgi:hypothetical protein
MYAWQSELLERMQRYKGRGVVQITGRQTGKSQMAVYQRMWKDIMESTTKVTDMKLAEGTIYGSRYYTVEPIGGNWLEMETWCVSTLGEGSRALWGGKAPEPARRWYANNRKFWFRYEADRTMFIMRWR